MNNKIKNRIYYFSGTGNCLKLSEDIAEKIGDCEIVSISHKTDCALPENYDRIGFVFPVYFLGLPKVMDSFLKNLKPMDSETVANTYFFTVATCGVLVGNAIPQLNMRLKQKGACLHYGIKHIMFSNCVQMYDMNKNVDKITQKSDENAKPIIDDIKNLKRNSILPFNILLDKYYKMQIGRVNNLDYDYNADNNCSGCGICASVCPVENILIENKKPAFRHQCEFCSACIQYCPNKSLNYKNTTQKRRRYHHPKIGFKKISNSRESDL